MGARLADTQEPDLFAEIPVIPFGARRCPLGLLPGHHDLAGRRDGLAGLGAGIVGLAVGFAAKDTLSNLFAGSFIIADAPYQIGDYILLDSGECGKVELGIDAGRLEGEYLMRRVADVLPVGMPGSSLGVAINRRGQFIDSACVHASQNLPR